MGSQVLRRARLGVAATATVLVSAVLLANGCSTGPKYAPCSNDGDCKEARYPYCMQSRCVECVSRASCNGGACNAGLCEIACRTASDCLHGDACSSGKCTPM
jgi:hypothetical protein